MGAVNPFSPETPRSFVYAKSKPAYIGLGLNAAGFQLNPLFQNKASQGFDSERLPHDQLKVRAQGMEATFQAVNRDQGNYRLFREETGGYFLHFRPAASQIPGEYEISHPAWGSEVNLKDGSFIVAVKSIGTEPKHLGLPGDKPEITISVSGILPPSVGQDKFLKALMRNAERYIAPGMNPEFAVITADEIPAISRTVAQGLERSKIMQGKAFAHGRDDEQEGYGFSQIGGTRASIQARRYGEVNLHAMMQDRHDLVQANTVIHRGGREYVELSRLNQVLIGNVSASFVIEDGEPGLRLKSPITGKPLQEQFVPVKNGQPIIFGRYGYKSMSEDLFQISQTSLSLEDFPGISSTKKDVVLVGTPSRDEIRTILCFQAGVLMVEQISSDNSSAATAILVK